MRFYDKKFLYADWDSGLEGKEVFVADTIVAFTDEDLKPRKARVHKTNLRNPGNPFTDEDGVPYRYAYFDPNYDLKVAHDEGKRIQRLAEAGWFDEPFPLWADGVEYRVKPEHEDKNIVVCDEILECEAQIFRLLDKMNSFTSAIYRLVVVSDGHIYEVEEAGV